MHHISIIIINNIQHITMHSAHCIAVPHLAGSGPDAGWRAVLMLFTHAVYLGVHNTELEAMSAYTNAKARVMGPQFSRGDINLRVAEPRCREECAKVCSQAIADTSNCRPALGGITVQDTCTLVSAHSKHRTLTAFR
jgi:hypothetical protein